VLQYLVAPPTLVGLTALYSMITTPRIAIHRSTTLPSPHDHRELETPAPALTPSGATKFVFPDALQLLGRVPWQLVVRLGYLPLIDVSKNGGGLGFMARRFPGKPSVET
jgi:hypothetical protein